MPKLISLFIALFTSENAFPHIANDTSAATEQKAAKLFLNFLLPHGEPSGS
jgi:hypothetical protein